MVGAGGIGCELLKNLVLMGFAEIEVVDLDTIDLSNLNRQFLFRQEHIKKPKALVAKESAGKFNPNVKIEAHHANIKDPQFNNSWYKTFDLVFNALDNMDARRHVNAMCIAADIPLVESGTTGYMGQSSVIKKGVTECYECYPKEQPKTFPVCTIRNTPSQPIHCIVWAKSYLFAQLFGPAGEEASELDFSIADNENEAGDLKQIKEEMIALQDVRKAIGTTKFGKVLFDKVFKQDIEALRSMEDIWKSGRTPPTPFEYTEFMEQQLPDGRSTSKQDQGVWSPSDCFVVFQDSLQRLTARLEKLKVHEPAPVVEFDKDDVDTLDFVAAIANLRAYTFGIEATSKFDIKQMAGNIIPAIATTNAIIAGACVLQAVKVFRGDFNKAPMFVTARSTDRLMASDHRPPNPKCDICSQAQTQLTIDPVRARLGDLVTVLKDELGYGEDVSIFSQAGLIYENDEDMEENLSKSFSQLGIKGDNVVTVTQDPKVNLLLTIQEQAIPEESAAVKLLQKVEVPDRFKDPVVAHTNGVTNGTASTNLVSGERRKRSHSDQPDGRPATKLKTGPAKEVEVVVLDVDGTNGAIVVDDD
jgi:ubiquitin-like 1-activating enzyme E1 B